jgi:hypothetical protein
MLSPPGRASAGWEGRPDGQPFRLSSGRCYARPCPLYEKVKLRSRWIGAAPLNVVVKFAAELRRQAALPNGGARRHERRAPPSDYLTLNVSGTTFTAPW